MEKAIVLGTFHFVGFALSAYLLEKGNEVKGLYLTNEDKEEEFEDKMLEMGRNANFSIHHVKELPNILKEDVDKDIYIPLYDYYMLQKEEFWFQEVSLKQLFDKEDSINREKMNLVFLLPMQWEGNEEFLEESIIEELQFLTNLLKETKINYSLIYLPSLYGPWQEDVFLYQQAILNELGKSVKTTISEREYKEDILFIDDAIEEVVELSEVKANGSFRLKHESQNQWQKGAEILKQNVDSVLPQYPKRKSTKDVKTVVIKNNKRIEDGLEDQRVHNLIRQSLADF